MIHFRDYVQAARIADALTSGLVSSQHTHHSLALYVTILEMWAFGREYAAQMLKNAQRLGRELRASGFNLLERDGEFTASNILLLRDTRPGWHVEACRKLYACGIATNSRHAFGQEVIRMGVQEITRQGMTESDMAPVAAFLRRALLDGERPDRVKADAVKFNKSFTDVHYSFDLSAP
jgi:glycine/serine hydroxymethyltransferase